jgi:hypothetical protein
MPLISVSGTQGIGKSTFIEDFIANWPMYRTLDKTYRDVIKDNNLSINQNTTKESQRIILESIVEDLRNVGKDEYVIFDRSPLDNIVYSIWAYDKNKGDIDDAFVADCINISRHAIQKLDLMLMIPMTKQNPELVDDSLRDIDPTYQSEIDELFKGLKKKREENDDVFFVKNDSPMFIEVFGSREARVEICKLYLNEEGNFYGEEDSLILDSNGDAITAGNEIDTGEVQQLRESLGLQKDNIYRGDKYQI